MMGIEFVKNKNTKEPFTTEDDIGLRIAKACQKRGLIGRPLGNILILSPTLIMDEEMIMQIDNTLRSAITEVVSDFRA